MKNIKDIYLISAKYYNGSGLNNMKSNNGKVNRKFHRIWRDKKREMNMKKLVTITLIIMAMTFVFAVGVFADSPVTLTSAVTYAPEGYSAMVYAIDETGSAVGYVYTVNGEDSEMTESSEYKAPISFGVNEIYVTAYDGAGDVIGQSEPIEIIGNEYAALQTHKNYDFDSTKMTFRTNQGSVGDPASIVSKEVDLSEDALPENASHGKVAYLKSENPVGEGSARNADITDWGGRSAFKVPYANGKNTIIFDWDIMPIHLDKISNIITLRYNNDGNGIIPFKFTADETVVVSTAMDADYEYAHETPVFDAPAEKWLNMKIIIDEVSEHIILVADGTVYSSYAFDSAKTDKKKLNFETTCLSTYIMFAVEGGGMGGEGKRNEFYVDNIMLKSTYHLKRYEFDANAKKDSESFELTAFPLEGGSVVIEFSEDMAEISKEDIVYEVNGQVTDFDFVFDAENDTVTITPYGAFLGREKCRVSFPDIKTGVGAIAKGDTFIDFTVDFPLCAILSCEADSVVPGEYATFDVEVRNTPDDSKDGIVMIAIYKDGGLERVGTAPLLCEGQTEESCEVSCFIPEGYNSDDYEMIAYYVYQNSLYVIDYIGIE